MSFAAIESTIAVHKELVQRCTGLSIDIGSSGAKFIYATKEDVEKSKESQTAVVQLHVITFTRDSLTEGLQFIRQRSYLFADDSDKDAFTVNVTGIGAEMFSKRISDALNVRTRVLMEFDCIVKAFDYTSSKLPRRDIVEQYDEQAVAEAVKYVQGMVAMSAAVDKNSEVQPSGLDVEQVLGTLAQCTGWSHASIDSANTDLPLAESEPDLYPYLLFIAGSCMFSLKVTGPGVYFLSETNPCGGRTMLGLANFVADCKTYDEFVSLASRGSRYTIDQMTTDLFFQSDSRDTSDNWYKAIEQMPGILAFNFGKTVGANRDDFKREDLAAALLSFIGEEFARTVLLACQLHKVRRVFFGGSLLSHPHARHVIAKEMIIKNLLTMVFSKTEPVIFDFIKSGGHLAALGCLVCDGAQTQQGEQ